MNKLLNRLMKGSLMGVRSAAPVGPNAYEPSIPRVALGIAGAAMTVITLAVSVILPAQMNTGSGEPRTLVASKATAPASMAVAIITRFDVVAAREPGSSTVPARLGKTPSPAVVRVSSTDH